MAQRVDTPAQILRGGTEFGGGAQDGCGQILRQPQPCQPDGFSIIGKWRSRDNVIDGTSSLKVCQQQRSLKQAVNGAQFFADEQALRMAIITGAISFHNFNGDDAHINAAAGAQPCFEAGKHIILG